MMNSNASLSNLSGEIAINKRNLTVVRKVGEGGFSFVYLVKESQSDTSNNHMSSYDTGGQQYCLKATSVQTDEQKQVSETETKILKEASGHPNFVTMVDVQMRPSGRGKMDHLILMEFCAQGHAFDVVKSMKQRGERWNVPQLLRSFGQICSAVSFLHERDITHRDLKLENFLVQGNVYKLCDFGSCIWGEVSTKNALERTKAEEVIGKTTTQMYRAPEMVDLYMRQSLTSKTDIWALGCCLYTMLFFKNTFEEGSNLAILSAKYEIPQNHPYGNVPTLLKRML